MSGTESSWHDDARPAAASVTLVDLVRLALGRLAASRLRSLLTMLGIIIGVASIVSLVAVGQGATAGITAQLAGLGTNLLTVNPGSSVLGVTRQAAGTATTLTLGDAEAIARIDGVAGVSPERASQRIVVAGDQNTTTSIVGTTEAYADVRSELLWQGAFLSGPAVDRSLRVAVLGAATADTLGIGEGDIGIEIAIDGIPFRVVGILQPKGGSSFLNQDDKILVPIGVIERYFLGGDSLRSIGVSVGDAERIAAVKALITSTLAARHDIAPGDSNDFSVFDQTQLLETVQQVTGLLSVLLAGIASISLVVGGIGIMNIMLVSVRERTHEIGIRKAIGARSRDILVQFLIEALTLSVIGGLLGIALGLATTALIGAVAGWGFVLDPMTLVIAVGFSLVVGVVFGVWPARQAARLDPIAALHYE
jgi:putative ABC transport system permease protein